MAAAAAVTAWRVFQPSDESQIRRQLSRIVELVNTPAEGLAGIEQASQLASFFTDDAVIDPGNPGPVRGRDAIMGVFANLRRQVRGFRAAIEDVTVVVGDDGQHATVELTATATSDDGTVDARELTVQMIRRGRQWLIASVQTVKVLER